jgi:hypothetical protein
MNRDDRVGGVVLAAEHLLGFSALDLLLERLERAFEIRRHILAGLRPLEEHAEIVDLLHEAVAQLEVVGKTALPLKRLLRLGLVVPEGGSGDFLFELR